MPSPIPGRYVVQLVNELSVTLLAGANAAHVAGQPPQSVLPREGTWILPPQGILTIDIPEAWEGTIPLGSLGPVLWARTGCRYSVEHNLAQCETGDCGGVYDCSKKDLTPPGPKALAEWTFKDENGNAAPDISVVDGINLTMDIVPLGTYSPTPVGPVNPAFWLGGPNLPLSRCGQDLRATCPAEFQLRRKDLTFFIAGSAGGDDVVGCFSNCGQYKFQGQLTGACPDGFRCAGEPLSAAIQIRIPIRSATTGRRSAPWSRRGTPSRSTVARAAPTRTARRTGLAGTAARPPRGASPALSTEVLTAHPTSAPTSTRRTRAFNLRSDCAAP